MKGYAWGVAAPIICTLLDWPLRHALGPASILMTYLLGVFLVASRFGRGASITASLLSMPVFAYFFAPPIFSLAINDLENIVSLAVMIMVSNITSNLLDRVRLQADIARQREKRANALYRLSQDLSNAQNSQAIATIAVQHIYDEFAAFSVLLLPGKSGQFSYPEAAPLNVSLQGVNLATAQQVWHRKAIQQQQQYLYLPIEGSQHLLGVLVIEGKAAFADVEVATLLDTFSNLIAQALERSRLAGQARDATLQAETEALRNALLSAISHDLRTPLTRIGGAISALMDGDEEIAAPERLDYYKVMLDETQRMAELTGKILDMARLSSGEIVLHQEWNALEEIVGSALTRLDKGLLDRPVRTNLPDSLPLVWIDAVLFEQVLVNLIENAIKYTPPGSPIDINAELSPTEIKLIVSDYGDGIPKGLEDKIFVKFFRCPAETPQGGVGLGLALCRAIIEAHQGSITATNISGKGAAFVIVLPRHEPPRFDQLPG